MRILVAEDKATTRLFLETILKNWGYEVIGVSNGTQALEVLMRIDAPRLALIDWKMPGMDGLEVIRSVRKIHVEEYVYAIIVTGKDSNEDLLEGMAAGADDYITKPFDPQELKVRLRAAERVINLQSELSEARRQELRIASRLQNSLLFGQVIHELEWAENAVVAQPALEIGGDFYDFFKINEACFDLVIGDVMGKGFKAALVSAGAKNRLLRAINTLMITNSGRIPPLPKDILNFVNREITPELIDLESFITCSYARFNREEEMLTIVDCGHVPVVKVTAATGKPELLKTQNLPLGVLREEEYRQLEIPFKPGDLFCFYTDGITETQNKDGELFGYKRLTETLTSIWNINPRRILGHFIEMLVEFNQGVPREDDMTFIAIKIR